VDGKVHEWFAQSIQLTNQAIDEVRTMSYLLHPPMLDEAGLAMALQWYVEGFARRSKIEVNLDVPEAFDRVAPDIELAIFRVVQESLTNIHRHSGSRKADITLTASSDELKLSIRDYGKGLPAEHYSGEAKGRMGVGLRGMAERIRQLGGTLFIRAATPGMQVEVRLPLSLNVVKNDSRVLHARNNQ
jgi:signal transduction histidine kinase